MEINNLIGPLPPKEETENSIFGKNLKTLKPAATPNWLVATWMGFREEEQYGFIMGFVNVPLFSVLGAINISRYFLIVLALWVYLEVSARIYWHQWLGSWVRGLFATPETPIPPYAEAVKMIRESPNEMERKSVLLGTVYGTNMPVLVPPELRRESVHITGPSRSGKTKCVRNPLIRQLMARKEDVFVFLDLGGDPTDAHEFREAAEAAGLPFYLFTIDPEKKSHVFNPLSQSYITEGSEVGSIIAQGLGIMSGSQEYGKWYFASRSETLGIREFKTFRCPTIAETMSEIDKLMLGELAKRLNLTARDIEHGEHINLELRKLALVPGLNGPDSEYAIDFKRIIEKGPAVIYFFLPVTHNLSAAVATARMAIHSLSGAVHKMPRSHTPVIVCIDEAQAILGMSLQSFYQQIGKFGVSIWTIHQNFQDLVNTDKNVLPMVVNNSAIGIHLGARDMIGKEHIESAAGMIKSNRRTVNAKGEESITEIFESRISTADFETVNAHKELAFVTINGRAGFASFQHTFICRLLGFSCSLEDYQRYLAMPWPELANAVDQHSFAPKAEEEVARERPPKEKAAAVLAALAAMGAGHKATPHPSKSSVR